MTILRPMLVTSGTSCSFASKRSTATIARFSPQGALDSVTPSTLTVGDRPRRGAMRPRISRSRPVAALTCAVI